MKIFKKYGTFRIFLVLVRGSLFNEFTNTDSFTPCYLTQIYILNDT